MNLAVSALHCRRGERVVLSDLTFTAAGGEAVAVAGPNGAGKTTLLRTLAGLVRPMRGTMVLAGGEPDATLPEQCHFVSHRDPVKAALSVAENLRFWASFYGGDAGIGTSQALAAFGVDTLADLPAGYLSAGQRRRLSLARLLAVRRPVWLLDEPTAALDADGQTLLGAAVSAHLAGGGIVVAATHMPLPFMPARTLTLKTPS